jgi:hypothetical protein
MSYHYRIFQMLSGGLIDKWKEDAFLEMVRESRRNRRRTHSPAAADTRPDDPETNTSGNEKANKEVDENEGTRRITTAKADDPGDGSGTTNNRQPNSPRALSVADMQGLFFAWMIGVGVGIFAFAAELAIARYRVRVLAWAATFIIVK